MGVEEVDEVHFVVYRIVMPILVFLGIVANALCLWVLTRPSLRSMRANWYFLALAASDMVVCILHIPIITTITGCTFSSYGAAFYFTHFGWTMIGVMQTFGVYIIALLSFDRFIAVWKYEDYPRIQLRPNVKSTRLLGTGFACVAFHLVYMVQATVYCQTSVPGDDACEHGRWVGLSGYQYGFDQDWHKVYSVIYGLCIRWVPSAFLIFFNSCLVFAVAKGRVNVPLGSQTQGRNGERNLVIITIAITVSYALFTMPIMIYITGFASSVPDRCSGNHPKEVLRAVGNTLQLFEHVIHIFFLVGLNTRFRKELKCLLRLEERTEGGALGRAGGEKSQNGVDKECVERGQGKGNNLELPGASPSFQSTRSQPTISQDLNASTGSIAVS